MRTRYVGLDLRSPVIVASAGITGTAERMKKAEDHGAGAVVVKTLFQEPLMAHSPTPRFSVLNRRFPGASSTTLYSYEQGFEYEPERYFEEIAKAKRSMSIPVIASIGGLTDDVWVDWTRKCEQAGADAIELNLSCPHGAIVMNQSRDLASIIKHVTNLVSETVSIPVITKMSPQMSDPLANARIIEASGARACVMFSRFPGLDVDVDTARPIMHGGSAGHGGPWAIHYALHWIAVSYPHLGIEISGCGGVFSGEDAIKYILAGAAAVQVAGAVILNGYEWIGKINREISEYMDRHGTANIEEIRGKAVPNVLGLDQVDRRKKAKAQIDATKCTGCALCGRVCIYGAAVPETGTQDRRPRFTINGNCDGCGLCVEVCPADAIAMRGVGRW